MPRTNLLALLGLLLSIVVLTACGVEPGDDEDADADAEVVDESEEALVAGPTWKMVTLVMKNLDASFVKDGKTYRAKGSMTTGRLDQARASAAGVKAKFEKYNGGRALASMTTIVVPEAITHLSFPNGDASRGYTVSASDVAAQLDKYAPVGRYDSVFVIWDPAIGSPDVPVCCAWGRGLGADTNGMTFAAVYPDTGPEGMVHEWLHGAGVFYRDHGFDVPDPHENRIFGFPEASPSGSWGSWYTALMRGKLLRAREVVGYASPVWRSGTPRRWIGGTYPAPSKPALDTPSIRAAEAKVNGAYLEWNPVKRPTNYVATISIRRQDGTWGVTMSKYVTPEIDRGSYDYFSFPKADICKGARETSGVDLRAVRTRFTLTADFSSDAARRDVDGTFDCR